MGGDTVSYKIRSRKTIEKEVINRMKDLNVYRVEHKNIVDIFVGMLHQYEAFEKQFEESGYMVTEEYTNKAKATNQRKVPVLSAIEKLRMDIATYSNLLKLNPKSLDQEIETQNTSKLANVLNKLDDKK